MSTHSVTTTYDEFLDKLYVLCPIGNAEVIYQVMLTILNKPLPTKELLTFELLCKRFKDYQNFIKPFNAGEKQFIKKDKEEKELGAYIQLEMYKNDYSKQHNDPNDFYLFGV
jgi:hypothetical protein